MRLGYRILARHPGAVLVLGHGQRALIGRDRGFEQAFLLVHHPQLQVVLHQFRSQAQANRRHVGQACLGTGLIGGQAVTQLAPQVGLPADPKAGAVSVADAAAGVTQARAGTAGALAGAVLASAQVDAGEQRTTGAAHQRLGLTVLGFGLGDGLVAGVELFDQVVQLGITVQLPPGTTGQGVGRIGLGPASSMLERHRFRRLRALVVRAQGAGAEHRQAQAGGQQARATGAQQLLQGAVGEKRTSGHSGVSKAASVRTPRQWLKRWRKRSR
ncbi:hypothetical protein D9M71_433540 [compost metagenome]